MIWDPATGELKSDMEVSREPLLAIAVVPGASSIVAGGLDGQLRVIDYLTARTVDTWPSRSGAVLALAVSPDGKLVAAGTREKAAMVWDIKGRLKFKERQPVGEVTAVAFSPDGASLAIGSAGSELRIVNTRSGKQTESLEFPGWVYTIGYASQGNLLAAGGSLADAEGREGGELRLWKTGSPEKPARSRPHSLVCYRFAFSPDSKFYATCGNVDLGVKIWDTRSGTLVKELQGHSDGATAISFSPDGTILATGGRDKTILIWNFGQEIAASR